MNIFIYLENAHMWKLHIAFIGKMLDNIILDIGQYTVCHILFFLYESVE